MWTYYKDEPVIQQMLFKDISSKIISLSWSDILFGGEGPILQYWQKAVWKDSCNWFEN